MRRTLVHQRTRHPHAWPATGVEQTRSYPIGLLAAVLVLLALTVWSYWPIIVSLAHTLRTNSDYSSGQLVPLVAIFLVWWDRKALQELPLIPCWSGGLLLLLSAEAARIYGFLSMRQSLEQYALVLALAGLTLLVAGGRLFRRVSWILLFLFLMMPLPNVVHSRISPPLQRLATTGSVFLLEALGCQVTQQGNIVMLNERTSVAVAEACSGLRMLTAFIIVAALVVYVVKRPRSRKAVLFVSSIPIAVICNILRISLTALLMLYVNEQLAEKFFHDFAGFVMMPAAVSLLFGELWLMDRLTEQPGCQPPQGQVVVRAKQAPSAPKASRT
jgi:exosortase